MNRASGRAQHMRHIVVVLLACSVVLATDIRAQGLDPWTGKDKALHLAAGSGLAAGGYALGALAFEDREKRIVAGLGLSLAAGAGKELYDWRSGRASSWRDFTWSAAGAATGATIAWLVDRFRHPRRAMPVAPSSTERHTWQR
jgi:putative lipoprotein